jgi:hypothetical protein
MSNVCLNINEHFRNDIRTRIRKNAKDEIYLNVDCNFSKDIPMKINVVIRYNVLALIYKMESNALEETDIY